MAIIKVTMRDGEVKNYADDGLSSRGYKVRLRHEPGWVIIQDSYGEAVHLPAADVARIIEIPDR